MTQAALPASEQQQIRDAQQQHSSGSQQPAAEYEFPVDFGSVAEATAAAASMGFSRFAPKMMEVEMPAGSAATIKQCSACNTLKPASQFSNTQLTKKAASRKCIECAASAPSAKGAPGARVEGSGGSGGGGGGGGGVGNAAAELHNLNLKAKLRKEVDVAANSVGRGGSKEVQKEIGDVYQEVEVTTLSLSLFRPL